MSRAGAFLAAVGGGCATAAVVGRLPRGYGTAATAVGLVVAAGIYPASRYRRSRPTIVEIGAMVAGGGVTLSAYRLPQRRARDVVAIAWLAHAAFDARFDHAHTDTALPAWYPAACAGYDIGLGGALLVANRRTPM